VHTGFSSILEAARVGAEWAWIALYRDLSPFVLGYLRSRGAAEPEDMLGEVFLQVVRDLPGFKGDERDFRSWVLTVAHHRLLDDRRHRGRRPVDPAPAQVLESAGPTGDAEWDALERIGADRVRALIGGLSPDQQSVLLLRIIGGLTVEEVARTLGKRPGAVKALQRRGLATIERRLSEGA
jgi:RNA polymerase sigma factor (sigma-70 family)